MELISLPQEEIDEIKRNKIIYSIIKYNQIENEDLIEMYKNKYMYAIYLNDGNINENEQLDKVVDFLEKEKLKIAEIKEKNQPIIDSYIEDIAYNLNSVIEDCKDDIEKCTRLFEYVVKTISFNKDAVDYNERIPFGLQYPIMDFYNNIPLSKTYEGMLVTKSGTSSDIANLMVYLGYLFDLDIRTIPSRRWAIETNDEEIFSINVVNLNGRITYMNPTSVILGDSEIQEACLVNKTTLDNQKIRIDIFDNIRPEGENIKAIYSQAASAIEKVISRERNDILNNQKSKSL